MNSARTGRSLMAFDDQHESDLSWAVLFRTWKVNGVDILWSRVARLYERVRGGGGGGGGGGVRGGGGVPGMEGVR